VTAPSRIDFGNANQFNWNWVLKKVPNERSSCARNELHQLHRSGQLERNTRFDLDRSWGRMDGRAAEACSGSLRQITDSLFICHAGVISG
jgi:hypothetical protein